MTALLTFISSSEKLDLILPSSGLLRGVRWFETDVSGLPTSLTFKGQSVDFKPRHAA